MKTRTVIPQILIWYVVVTSSGCMVIDSVFPPADTPFFMADPSESKDASCPE
jgi:hypothetical protein